MDDAFLGLALPLLWWLGGWAFSVWEWQRQFGRGVAAFDSVDIAIFGVVCIIFGPLPGLIWAIMDDK